jgi:hypothetical protein
MRPSRSRLMRPKGINPNPPICRSKENTLCQIQFYDCFTNEKTKSVYRRTLNLNQCRELQLTVTPSKGAMYWENPKTGEVVNEQFNTCSPQTWFCVLPDPNSPP